MAIEALIASAGRETRTHLRDCLQGAADIEVVGWAETGRQAVETAQSLRVDVVILDSRLPAPGALEVAERVTSLFPDTGVVLLAPQANAEEMRRAMLAGVTDYLVEPVGREDLLQSVTDVYQRVQGVRRSLSRHEAPAHETWSSKVVAVYGPRGGVGKSLLAANLASALALEADDPVALVDLDLEFGNLDLLLNVTPERTIASLLNRMHQLDADLLEGYLTPHPGTGLMILAAPYRPNHAETITAGVVEQLVQVLRERHRYIVIDTPSNLRDTTLTALELADLLFLLTAPDLLALHSTRVALEMMRQLRYQEEKVRLVVSRADCQGGISPQDVQEAVGLPIASCLPDAGPVALESINQGVPVVLRDPRSPLAQAIASLGQTVRGQALPGPTEAGGNGSARVRRRGLFQALLGRPS